MEDLNVFIFEDSNELRIPTGKQSKNFDNLTSEVYGMQIRTLYEIEEYMDNCGFEKVEVEYTSKYPKDKNLKNSIAFKCKSFQSNSYIEVFIREINSKWGHVIVATSLNFMRDEYRYESVILIEKVRIYLDETDKKYSKLSPHIIFDMVKTMHPRGFTKMQIDGYRVKRKDKPKKAIVFKYRSIVFNKYSSINAIYINERWGAKAQSVKIKSPLNNFIYFYIILDFK